MLNILIHIGYPKTATTWFQRRFFPGIKNFIFVDRKDIVEHLIHQFSLDFNADLTREFFINKYGDNMILSLEGFIGTTHNFGLNGYMTKEHSVRLKEVFPEAKIIVFIREQHEIILSSYYQYISGGGTYSIKSYLNKKYYRGLNGLTLFSFDYFNYDKLLRLYYDLFSQDQVHPYIYEEFRDNNKFFLKVFCSSFNLKIDLNQLDYSREKQKFHSSVILIARVLNLFMAGKMINKFYIINLPYWNKIRKRILGLVKRFRIFEKQKNTKQVLGNEVYKLISEKYKASNQILIDQYKLDKIKEYNYPL